MTPPQQYRFADASKPGVLLGLSLRQAAPLIAAAVWFAGAQVFNLPAVITIAGPLLGLVACFGRWSGLALAEITGPAVRLLAAKATGTTTWTRTSLLGAGPGYHHDVPAALTGLELLETQPHPLTTAAGTAVIHDTTNATLTAVLQVHGSGFALASTADQDATLATWGSALAPFARDRSPITRVAWHEWAHADANHNHHHFLTETGLPQRTDPLAQDYRSLVDQHAHPAVSHQVLITLTVDLRRLPTRRGSTALAAGLDVLHDETARFAERLIGIGLRVDTPLSPAQLTRILRTWSDPTKARQVDTLARSLAAATGRGTLEWGPMASQPGWHHVNVDASVHRSYRVANWPLLPVGADWLNPLITESGATRTVTVVMEPVPIRQAASTAEREVMHREADAAERSQRGFFVSAKHRKQIRAAQQREEELTEGHAEFRFIGLVDVTAPDLDRLDDACAEIEQAAAQSLLDLRALDARHHLGWVASLPLGRGIARTRHP